MKAVVTEGFLESIPAKIRSKLHLKTGMVMDFDESTPYLKATPAAAEEPPAMTDEEFEEWVKDGIGIVAGKFTTDEVMRETRGED